MREKLAFGAQPMPSCHESTVRWLLALLNSAHCHDVRSISLVGVFLGDLHCVVRNGPYRSRVVRSFVRLCSRSAIARRQHKQHAMAARDGVTRYRRVPPCVQKHLDQRC